MTLASRALSEPRLLTQESSPSFLEAAGVQEGTQKLSAFLLRPALGSPRRSLRPRSPDRSQVPRPALLQGEGARLCFFGRRRKASVTHHIEGVFFKGRIEKPNEKYRKSHASVSWSHSNAYCSLSLHARPPWRDPGLGISFSQRSCSVKLSLASHFFLWTQAFFLFHLLCQRWKGIRSIGLSL